MSDLIREALIKELEFLDEKEALADERRRNKRAPLVPQVVAHPWGKPRGLGGSRPVGRPPGKPTRTALNVVATKMATHFRKWAEYLEEAEDRIEIDRRTTVIQQELRDRTSNEDEVRACYEHFKDFFQERLNVRQEKMAASKVDAKATYTPSKGVDADVQIVVED